MKGLGKRNCLKRRMKWQGKEMADGKELAKHDCLKRAKGVAQRKVAATRVEWGRIKGWRARDKR